MKSFLKVLPVVLVPLLVAACGDDDSGTPSPDAGPIPDPIADFTTPTRLDNLPIMALNELVTSLQLESTPSGDMVAVWEAQVVDGDTGLSTPAVAGRERSAGGAWGSSRSLAPLGTQAGGLSVDAAGNALVALVDPAGLSARRYDPSGRLWGAPEALGPSGSRAAVTSMSRAGGGYAVWIKDDHELWLQPYATATGWGAAELLLTVSDGYLENPRVGAADSGAALVTYEVEALIDAPPGTDTRAVSYTPGAGASAPVVLASVAFNGTWAARADLHVFPDGTAIFAFEQEPTYDVPGPLLARRYVPGAGWMAPEALSEASAVAVNPAIGANDEGRAIVGFAQKAAGAARFEPRVNHYEPGSGWSGSSAVMSSYGADCRGVAVALDEHGQALAAVDDGNDIDFAAYTPATGWSAPRAIADARVNPYLMRMVSWGDGRFTLGWVTIRGLSYAADWPAR